MHVDRLATLRMTRAGGTTEVVPFPFVLHAGAVVEQANSRFLDSAVAGAPAALGMTRLGDEGVRFGAVVETPCQAEGAMGVRGILRLRQPIRETRIGWLRSG